MRPIAYNKGGVYTPISNTLGLSGDPAFTIGADELMQARFKARLSGNAPVAHIGFGGDYVRISPLNTNDVDAIVEGQSVLYPGAWNNADLKYTVTGHAVRKDIFLRTGHPASFSFRLDEKKTGEKLTMQNPYMRKGILFMPLQWEVSRQAGKEIYTITLPAGDWDGWTVDPTYSSQPDATAGKDVGIEDDLPTTNFDLGSFYIGEINSDAVIGRGLIYFDMSTIPTTATVTSGTFEMTIAGDYSSNARTFNLHRLLVDWTENQATWNKRNSSNDWNTSGCGGSGTDYDATVHGSVSLTSTETVDTAKNFTLVASEIEKFVNGSYTNYGWRISAGTENNDMYGFYSSDEATAAYRPKLTVEYTEGAADKTKFFFHL